jgi:cytochrome c5
LGFGQLGFGHWEFLEVTSRVRHWGLSIAGACVLIACGASQHPHATAADVAAAQKQRAGVTLQDLEQGRSLYLSRCGACHALVDPKSVAASKWPHEVAEMKQRAKLSDEQVERISLYLFAVSQK